ncbi:oxygenase MpaB family protein [Sphingomonas carotinifaciens]|uniref:oxygenase MpaB family protein n=1 Tax=Sphingomonas TaxID=13687 RepID=UPI001F079920|nr:oxygenase MpaB family protein [Sphingomonas carotinifaciens]
MSIRLAIRDQVRGLVGSGSVDLSRPPGDPGLFGPGSATWTVHGDFTAMMVGGICSLLVQMLHPAALAGVWDHSDFRGNMGGRLKRTAQFISVTTFGSTAAAESAIARVRRVHEHVAGTLPDGTAYRASDPRLLTFVHVAEVDSFLRGYLTYRDPAFPAARQDQYLCEMAMLARALGAEDVPEDRAGVAAFLAAIRPELRVDARTRTVAKFLLNQPSPHPSLAPMNAMMMGAGVDLLPPWAARLHGRMPVGPGRPMVRAGTMGMGAVLRWALKA